MTTDVLGLPGELPSLVWPLALLVAWVAGEAVHRRWHWPRISAYALTGIVLAPGQLGLLIDTPLVALLAHVALGLLLFELGYRVNLAWFVHNRWLAPSGLLDAVLSFAALTGVARALGVPAGEAALLGALGMASSPAAIVRVMHEERGNGQIAERLLHLAFIGCVLAVVAFKAMLAVHLYQSTGSWTRALWTGGWSVLLSTGLGALAGLGITALLRVPQQALDATVPYALTVVGLVALTHALQLSPIVASLALGLTARHRRVVFSRSEQGFGVLGDLLCVILFVFVGSRLDIGQAASGLALGAAFIATRLLVTPSVMALTGPLTGTTVRKGALTGLGLMPVSAFVLMLLEQSRHDQLELLDRLAPLAAAALVLEVLGPLCSRWALVWGGEVRR